MNYFKANKFFMCLGKKTYVMAILNITPDSFSDGGIWNDPKEAVKKAISLKEEGADIIDIGAQSTRPGFNKITQDEEIRRLKDIIPDIRKEVDLPLSIDTFYPEVARYALGAGVDIVNDITGFKNKKMIEAIKSCDCGLIVMHGGEEHVETNQCGKTSSKQGVLGVKPFFQHMLKVLNENGIKNDRICFDPGIGFSKTYEENIYILKNIQNMRIQDCAMLVGASRKRVIGQSCGDPPFKDRTPGTIAAHTISIAGGTDIIRVHDVREAVQAIRVADAILR